VIARQLRMFQTDDLPLFSGTSPRGNGEPLVATPEQQLLPTACKLCRCPWHEHRPACLFGRARACWDEGVVTD
jgi:hypothetical protein